MLQYINATRRMQAVGFKVELLFIDDFYFHFDPTNVQQAKVALREIGYRRTARERRLLRSNPGTAILGGRCWRLSPEGQ
jgi:hypothetical protein